MKLTVAWQLFREDVNCYREKKASPRAGRDAHVGDEAGAGV